MSDYREAVELACHGLERTVVVHGIDLMPAREALFVDGVHPNAEGMAVFAETLMPYLRLALGRS
jgi:lysophospholipase L1-like esterase